VADARAGRQAGEPAVGDQRDVSPGRWRRAVVICARASPPAPLGPTASGRVALVDEHSCGAAVAERPGRRRRLRIDRRRFDQ
jgi:hypothetical protein